MFYSLQNPQMGVLFIVATTDNKPLMLTTGRHFIAHSGSISICATVTV